MKNFQLFIAGCIVFIVLLWLTSCHNFIPKKSFYYDITKIPKSNKINKPDEIINENVYLKYCPGPTVKDHTPWRGIKVNIHFIRKSNGTGNFDSITGIQYARQMIDAGNFKIANNKKMVLPVGNNTPVIVPNFGYEITPRPIKNDIGIYFHDDDSIYNLYKSNDATLFNTAVYDKYGIQKNNVLNIFMMEQAQFDTIQNFRNPKGAVGVSFGGFIKINHSYYNYLRSIKDTLHHKEKDGGWCAATALNHEIGHSLGIGHTWNGDDCSDTPNNANKFNNNSDTLKAGEIPVSNNVMDYNVTQEAYTPCQIGKIHYNFCNKNSISRKLLDSIWCKPVPNQVLWIGSGDTIIWESIKELINSAVVFRNTTLIIKNTVSFPINSNLVIEPGSSVIVDGGLLTNTCNLNWLGVLIKQRGFRKGKIYFINGGKIDHVEIAPKHQ